MVHPKCEKIFGSLYKFYFFQCCNNNIVSYRTLQIVIAIVINLDLFDSYFSIVFFTLVHIFFMLESFYLRTANIMKTQIFHIVLLRGLMIFLLSDLLNLLQLWLKFSWTTFVLVYIYIICILITKQNTVNILFKF